MRRNLVKGFTGLEKLLVETFMTEQLPDKTDRTEFAAKVLAERMNPDYHLYTYMYVTFGTILISDISLSDENRGPSERGRFVCLDELSQFQVKGIL